MNTTLKLQNTSIELTAKLNASGVYFPNSNTTTLHNEFLIFVKHGKTKFSFRFYDSQANFNKGIEQLSEEDILNAFYCFLSDAVAAEDIFADFCSNFGYTERSGTSKAIYRLCQKSNAKAKKIFSDVCDACNELSELINN